MRALIWMIILFAVAGAIALLSHYFEGSVHVLMGETLYSSNVNTVIIGILVIALLLYVFFKILGGFISFPSSIKRFFLKRGERKLENKINELGLAYFEGRYDDALKMAEKLLFQGKLKGKKTLVLVLAAYSAEASGNNKEALQRFLKELGELPEKKQLSRFLLLANNAITHHDEAGGAEYLVHARQISKNNPSVLKLDLRLALAQKNAKDIIKCAEKLQKKDIIREDEVLTYRTLAYRYLLKDAKDPKALKSLLKQIPVSEKSTELLLDVAKKYQDVGLYNEAVLWVKKYYPESKNVGLLSVLSASFPYLTATEQNKIMEEAESWLKISPNDDELLLTLGKIAYHKQLWGKAQSYLEASLSVRPSVAAYLTLAQVFLSMDKTEEAQEQQELAMKYVVDSE